MTERTGKGQVLFSALLAFLGDGEIAIDTEGYHTKEGVTCASYNPKYTALE
jgi:hypothetical protein